MKTSTADTINSALCTKYLLMNENIILAFTLTLIAGLSTGIGSAIALFLKKPNEKFLTFSLGLSAGVMTYVSFMEMMPESLSQLQEIYSEKQSNIYMILAFFAGIALIALIDNLISKDTNPHEIYTSKEDDNRRLKRTGLMVALAIVIHNFPEGLATFTAALVDIDVALPIMFAIAIHNIPEGIAVSIPIYHATGNKKKAFYLSFLSGMAEPLGALLGYLFLQSIWTPTLNALILAFISGIMIYISYDELLPNTERYGYHHLGVFGIIAGMGIMAFSLICYL